MPRQSRQRWNCARLSEPISQTNSRFGYRRVRACNVSAVYRVPSSRSIAVTRIRARFACAIAERTRVASGAIPSFGLSGLPGDTSHQTSSSRSERSANSEIRRWAPCAGLKLPPSRPIRLLMPVKSGTCLVQETHANE